MLLTYFCSSVVLFQPKTPKTVNFKEYPVDLEGPIVVPEEEAPAKPVKQEKKFFDFFKKKKKVGRNYQKVLQKVISFAFSLFYM